MGNLIPARRGSFASLPGARHRPGADAIGAAATAMVVLPVFRSEDEHRDCPAGLFSSVKRPAMAAASLQGPSINRSGCSRQADGLADAVRHLGDRSHRWSS